MKHFRRSQIHNLGKRVYVSDLSSKDFATRSGSYYVEGRSCKGKFISRTMAIVVVAYF